MTDNIEDEYLAVLCTVGERKRVVARDLFIEVHQRLAEFYRELGFEGDKLDLHIVAALPSELEKALEYELPTQH